MRSGLQIEMAPGIVHYDGKRVEIDVSQLTDQTDGVLRFQLINSDTDFGSTVQISGLSNQVVDVPQASPSFEESRFVFDPDGPIDLAGMQLSHDIGAMVSNVRVDSATGQYVAELQLQNQGGNIGRQVVVSFQGLPSGVSLANASGFGGNGNPYLNVRPAIPIGGLSQNGYSDFTTIRFSNPNLEGFSVRPVVFDAGPNQPPQFDPVGPLQVLPGDILHVDLNATDPEGDYVWFAVDTDHPLPSGQLDANGRLTFRPTPDEIGVHEFEIIATDGLNDVSQTVTLSVVSDSMTTTRFSGFVLDTNQQPLVGIPIELGSGQTLTGPDGSFSLGTRGLDDVGHVGGAR